MGGASGRSGPEIVEVVRRLSKLSGRSSRWCCCCRCCVGTTLRVKMLPGSLAVLLTLFSLAESKNKDFYTFKVVNSRGKLVSLEKYRGSVSVNVSVVGDSLTCRMWAGCMSECCMFIPPFSPLVSSVDVITLVSVLARGVPSVSPCSPTWQEACRGPAEICFKQGMDPWTSPRLICPGQREPNQRDQ